MATSGYKDVAATYTTSGNVGDTLRFRWQLKSSSVIDNQSTINWWLELIAGGAGYISSSASKSWNVTVNGTSYSGSNTVGISNNTTKTLASGTTVVPHNADGTKTFTYSFSQVFNITFNKYVGTVSGSGSGVLDSIPRSSTISNVEGDTIGQAVTVTLARHNDAFTHQMWYKVGESAWYDLGSGIGTSKTFTVESETIKYITDDVTGTMQLCVRTYSGSTQIGTDTYKSIVVKVPDSVVPVINSITITEAVSGLASKFGAFIQNKSKLQITCDASGVSGSTIKSYKVEISGVSYTGQTITTDLISQSGDVPVKVTVTDSRGRTSTGTTSVTVLEYYLPTIERFDAYRSDAAGNEKNSSKTLACAYKFKVAPCGNKNDRTYKIEYRQTGAANWTTIASGSLYAADTKLIKEDILGLEYSYEVRLTVNDYFGTPATYPVKVGMEVVVWCPYPTGKGLGIGGYPKGEYLDVYMDGVFRGALKLADQTGDVTNVGDVLSALQTLAAGKRYSGYTAATEIINSTAYHGVKNADAVNDYTDLFVPDAGGAFFTYQGAQPCIVSGVVNAKIIKSGSDYVHIFAGVKAKDTEGCCAILTPYVDTSGRWYALPIHLVMEQGDRFYYLYTYSSDMYVKVERMSYQLTIDGFVDDGANVVYLVTSDGYVLKTVDDYNLTAKGER